MKSATITINGGGPLGQIVVDANGKGEVRGYVENPYVEVESIRRQDECWCCGRYEWIFTCR